MKKIFIYKIVIVVLGVFTIFTSCDEIDGPYGILPEISAPSPITRKAVMFEFTGIHCTNCPTGHEAIASMLETYNGHIIPISVHAGFFAQPMGSEDPDLRTAFGNQLFDLLGKPNTPAIVFEQWNADSVIVGGPSTWSGQLAKYIPQYSKYKLEPTLELSDLVLNVKYKITEREQVDNPVDMYAFILEDSIQTPQAGTDISPYYQNHVLRKCISNTSGNSITLSNKVAELSFSDNLDSAWNINQLYVVGIIIDKNTNEIYTGEIRKLTSN